MSKKFEIWPDSELALMVELEDAIAKWGKEKGLEIGECFNEADSAAVTRAVRWLAEKYGGYE